MFLVKHCNHIVMLKVFFVTFVIADCTALFNVLVVIILFCKQF